MHTMSSKLRAVVVGFIFSIGVASANEDPNWKCMWVDKPENTNTWGYHAGVDVYRYSATQYNNMVLGSAAGGALGAIIGQSKLSIVTGALVGAVIGNQFDKKVPFQPYMKCLPKE